MTDYHLVLLGRIVLAGGLLWISRKEFAKLLRRLPIGERRVQDENRPSSHIWIDNARSWLIVVSAAAFVVLGILIVTGAYALPAPSYRSVLIASLAIVCLGAALLYAVASGILGVLEGLEDAKSSYSRPNSDGPSTPP